MYIYIYIIGGGGHLPLGKSERRWETRTSPRASKYFYFPRVQRGQLLSDVHHVLQHAVHRLARLIKDVGDGVVRARGVAVAVSADAADIARGLARGGDTVVH